MGHPRKSRKKYDTPPHPWNAERIKAENKLMVRYGLKNKKEIWKADTLVRKYSREARYLLGFSSDQLIGEKNELLGHLKRQGILEENAQLEDILNLTVENVLRRRLQTMVHKKGLARTPKEARMFVIHGHIAMNGKKIDSPSYVVKKGEEDLIDFYTESIAKQIKEYNAGKDAIKSSSESNSGSKLDDMKSNKGSSKKSTKKSGKSGKSDVSDKESKIDSIKAKDANKTDKNANVKAESEKSPDENSDNSDNSVKSTKSKNSVKSDNSVKSSEGAEKIEKTEKTEKTEKVEKVEKPKKPKKAEKVEKAEK